MIENKETNGKIRSHSLFRTCSLLGEKSQCETRPRHHCHHALTLHLFGSVPLYPRCVFSRPPNPCRSSCIGPTPSTDEERQQSKMTSQAFPMIGSKVPLAFHSGCRRPQNCFGVLTRGKIQNFFQFCESDEPSQRESIACVSSEVLCCQLPSTPPSLSPSSLLPLPASTPTHTTEAHTAHPYCSLHPSASPSSHTPPPLSPPPTPAVHTLRTTKRWLREHFSSSCAIHQSSRLKQSRRDHITWRAAVLKDECDSDSKFMTPCAQKHINTSWSSLKKTSFTVFHELGASIKPMKRSWKHHVIVEIF